ncbi:MAG: AMP-binding protein [bacterium]
MSVDNLTEEKPADEQKEKALTKDDLASKADAKEQLEAQKRLENRARKAQRQIRNKARSTIFARLLGARNRHGGKTIAIEEADGNQVSYKDLVRAAFALGSAFRKFTARGENVGVFLPTSAGGIITFFALQVNGRVPAMLNFSAGAKNLFSALRTGQIKTIITSRRFIDQADFGEVIDQLATKTTIYYLEDIKEALSPVDKMFAFLGPLLPWIMRKPLSPNAPGVLLFTSGTEGEPKGVLLSQQNLVANIEQINEHVDLEETDIVFNPLPIFHSYGLTAGTLFPILYGYKYVPYPSPLHVKIIPEVIKKTKATIMFATDTFLHRYLKSARKGALSSMRYAVCGAEHVRDETRALAKSRFGFNVIEGYGMTEAAPVVAANQPGDIRSGTVGKIVPGIEAKLEPVAGLENAGKLLVRGPNVMLGYILPTEPGKVVPPEGGWHDTGDIVHIDGGGYMSIRGRVKRFAKIGGEMVSLAVVENCASVVWPDFLHAAIILPDPKKGEQIILMTECHDPDRGLLLSWAQSHGVPELAVPKRIITVEDIPVLGSGKVDYLQLTQTAKNQLERADRSG